MPNINSSAPDARPLDIDFTNIYADTVGATGITHTQVSTLRDELQRAHRILIERTAGGLDADYACLNLHEQMPKALPTILAAAEKIRRFEDLIVIGIGGSNLGAIAIHQALGSTRGNPRLHFVDNVDPDFLQNLVEELSPEHTGVITISKSGGTIESVTQYLVLRAWLSDHLGKREATQHQWIVTDPTEGWLRRLAAEEEIPALPVPPKVGGRYSVLTAVGLLPLSATGIDIASLLQGAQINAQRCTSVDLQQNPALHMAALYYLLDTQREKRVSIIMPYVTRLRSFGDWYRQLWAESLGKLQIDGAPAGTLPVPALGAVDQHSQLQMYLASRHDKIFAFLALDRYEHNVSIPLGSNKDAFPYLTGKSLNDVIDAEFCATRQVITDYGHPNLTVRLPALNAHSLGQLIDLYQRATVYTGLLYGINPLDQPAVETGKRLTVQYLRDGLSI